MDQTWPDFSRLLRDALGRFVAGDPEPYKALWARTSSVSVMGAFGGQEKGWQAVEARLDWASSQYDRWIYDEDVVAEQVGRDLAYRVHVARIRYPAASGGQVTERERRVTHIFERAHDRWRIVHLHADPLPAQLGHSNRSDPP